MSPPNTSQKAFEWKPEKTVSMGAIWNAAAARRKMRAVRYSGSAPEAQKPIVNTTSENACNSPSFTVAAGGRR
jgi:hypothetical protein